MSSFFLGGVGSKSATYVNKRHDNLYFHRLLKNYLFSWNRNDWGGRRQMFNHQMATTPRSDADQSQEPRIPSRSCKCIAGTQTLRQSSRSTTSELDWTQNAQVSLSWHSDVRHAYYKQTHWTTMYIGYLWRGKTYHLAKLPHTCHQMTARDLWEDGSFYLRAD